uniref:Uncharacterized protein n=1 Tax=Fagus sylvatica TaxID=28930 RepID=A0A2N9GYL7_FAGSY
MLSFVVLLGIHCFFEGNAGTSTSQVHSSITDENGLPEEGMDARLTVACHLTRFSKLYEWPSMRTIYLAERDLVTWRVGIPFESRVDVETSFKDYQETLMLPFRTPLPERHPPTLMVCDLRRADGLLVETSVDRQEGVYGLLIPPDCLLANNADLEDMIELVESLKILATQQSKDAYLWPYGDDGGDDGEGGQGSTPSRGMKRR